MAGLRLGYIIARPALITHFEKIRGPFAVNSVALVAAAAQLAHLDNMQAQVKEVMLRAKPFTSAFLRENNIDFIEGAANFFLVSMPNVDSMVEHLKSHQILVRPLRGPRLDGWVRMSLGSLSEMQRVKAAFESASVS